MISCDTNECGYCRSSIVTGQRWVREKVYDPASKNGREPQPFHRSQSVGPRLTTFSCIVEMQNCC